MLTCQAVESCRAAEAASQPLPQPLSPPSFYDDRVPNYYDVATITGARSNGACVAMHACVRALSPRRLASTPNEFVLVRCDSWNRAIAPIMGLKPRGITTRSAGRGGGLSSRGSTLRRVSAGLGGKQSSSCMLDLIVRNSAQLGQGNSD
eukprot:365684-Chlamydomonas_euryale.AAC.3